MALKDKLKGLPRVYYFNNNKVLDEHMDRSLSNLDVMDYSCMRIKYTSENISEWKDLISFSYTHQTQPTTPYV